MNPEVPRGSPGLTALASLRRFVRPRAVRERCGLCDAELADDHSHPVELSTRRLVCAYEPCAILFSGPGGTKYRRVPRRVRFLPDFRLTDEAWEGLQLPIHLAFFLHSTHWRGLSGGPAAWAVIGRFFEGLKERSPHA